MDINDLLDRCKEKLDITSDYALAKELGVLPARISGYRKNKEHPDTYVCFRIAEIVGESPAKIVAVVEAKNQKNEAKRLYFQRFFMIAALWITLGLMLPLFSGSYGSAYAAGKNAETRAVVDFQTIMRSAKSFISRVRRWFKKDKNVRYFTCNWHVKYFPT